MTTPAPATNQPPTNSPSTLAENIRDCIKHLAPLLVPPYDETWGDAFVVEIQKITGAEAVSLFLILDNPNQMEYFAGVGYLKEYAHVRYQLSDKTSLTAYVAATGNSACYSRNFLESQHTIPATGRCAAYINSGKFYNIIAVPLIFEKRCLGVLKLQNLGTDPSQEPALEHLELSNVLGGIVALAYQQRRFSQLWDEGIQAASETKSEAGYLQQITQILTRRLNAECAAAFLMADNDTALRFAAGVGFNKDFSQKSFDFDWNAPPASTLAFIAKFGLPLVKQKAELEQKRDLYKYTGSWDQHTKSRSFRNVLALPLQREIGAKCFGVLLVANKLPVEAAFDQHDEGVCRAFVDREILPTLESFRAADDAQLELNAGIELLREKAGKPERTPAKVALVKKLQNDKSLKLTGDQCGAYFGVSRATYNRWLNEYGLIDGKKTPLSG